ncbi:3-oxoacyl-(acyl-carrier-protein) reductase 2 (plasmid) [Rhizobium gallicum]|uniref:3-oxoacyl-(Acyl-carrier-protein) reductase 2 n=2 Tax=Rhizobium gallicum TaxID=56730 RepID=A0A1L5NPI0_9HYPH|nr:SDR family oxidoreductase [Rhizobium gallicum]APO69810.1 3-oxoacyl-(acyl-carrier-protein) reductase 2 [Rhizobium gallicum]
MPRHVSLVTGAASGIGLAIAQKFSRRGDAVVIADLNAQSGEAAAQALRDEGRQALFVELNVAKRDSWAKALSETEKAFGLVDVLVNNAGVIRDRSLLKMSDEDWELVVDVNLRGSWLGAQTVFPGMKSKGWGRIVNISSSAHRGGFGQANYSSAKAGIVGLTRTLAIEGAKNKILVNAVAPHNVNTPILATVPEVDRQAWLSKSRFGRFAEPDEIASVVNFLASDDNTVVSGQLIEADGADLVGAA